MASTKRLNVADLDFDLIKNSFKQFLSDQNVFTDYDFEGSAMSILLDVFSFNAHYHGIYANMVANESFIDSAVSRRSVTSLANQLGYTPRSIQSARAVVNVSFGSTRPTINGLLFDYLPTGSSFRTKLEGDVFNFVTKKPNKLNYNSETDDWYIDNIEITEGVVEVQNFIYNTSEENPKFVLNSNTIDTSSIVLRIQTAIDDTSGFSEVWNLNTNFASISSNSRVYFLEEKEDGQFQIYFGDGLIGRKPKAGNYITVQYLKTRGSDANGIGRTDAATRRTFDIVGYSNATVTVVTPAASGSSYESEASIRFNAPLYYQSQGRAVTANDYRSIVSANYGEADSVFVYGGEDQVPPQYGKVFVSIKPKQGTLLTDLEKSDISRNILANQNVLGIIPEIIDPDYIYMKFDVAATYDPSMTAFSESAIENILTSRIRLYGTDQLEKFDKSFYFSQFTRYLDDSDVSILGNQTTITLEKRLETDASRTKSYTIEFNNEIFHPEDGYKPVVTSTQFTIKVNNVDTICFFDDDGFGNIRIFKLVNDVKTIVNASAGSIDYTTGKIEIFDIQIIETLEEDAIIKVTVVPNNQNITTVRNMILLVDDDNISVTATQKTIIEEGSLNGIPFPFNT